MLTVRKIDKEGVGFELGLKKGDKLIKADGMPFEDIIDYLYWDGQESFLMNVQRGEECFECEVEKDSDESLGLDFYEELGTGSCKNNCIFCFINQLPKGLRKTLYVRDDDWRLSLLNGNFITLTNISEAEFEKILFYRISPLYISVHATDDNVRTSLLRPKKDACDIKILQKIQRLSEAGIKINAQAVIVPDINDGEVLKKTIFDLSRYCQSLAVVPAGITKFHRNGVPFTDKERARNIIRTVQEAESRLNRKDFVFLSDEMYIRAEMEIPRIENESQLGNGVGLIQKFADEFNEELQDVLSVKMDKRAKDSFVEGGIRASDSEIRAFDIVTGADNYPYLSAHLKRFSKHFPSIKTRLHKIKNNFFGETVTVSGLIVGGDILEQVGKNLLSKTLLLPECMLTYDGELFLDGMDISALEHNLGITVKKIKIDGGELVRTLLGS